MVSVHALVSYFNNYVLFPQLLRKKEYISYIISILLSLLLASFLITFILLQVDTIEITDKSSLLSFGFIMNNFIAITTTVAVTMSLKMVKQWYERERQNAQLEKLQAETELKFLKSQINPHFLFNSLNTIYALSIKQSKQTPEVILKLSEILRYLLYEGGEPMVPLDKEINYVRNFLELEKIRYGDRVAIHFESEGDVHHKSIAPMLLLTFLENSFKHGIQTMSGKSILNIRLVCSEDDIYISIINSYKPGEKRKNSRGGIGLENIKKRLRLMYPNRHELSIVAGEDKFEVHLRLLNNT
jgi:two-component system LytT family sensor kinase